MSDDIVVKDGFMFGGWRQPPNVSQGAADSIHNDEVAVKIGMRGGTIAGTIHLNLFPPLLIELFGQRWFERGTISMYYTYATLDREEVRAVVEVPPDGASDVQVKAWVETPEGRNVAKGTISVGKPDDVPYVGALPLESGPPEERRILARLVAGEETTPLDDVVVTQQELDKRLETITETLDWYQGKSPWGGSILCPDMTYRVLNAGFPPRQIEPAVGFFGGTEIRILDGPVKVGVAYRTTGKLVAVGATPKTEFGWVDSQLHEQESGRLVAEMRHMTRWMKASSPLYQTV